MSIREIRGSKRSQPARDLQWLQGKFISRKQSIRVELPLDSSQPFVLVLAVIEVGPYFLQHPVTKRVCKIPHISVSESLLRDEYIVVLLLPLLRMLALVAAEPVIRIE